MVEYSDYANRHDPRYERSAVSDDKISVQSWAGRPEQESVNWMKYIVTKAWNANQLVHYPREENLIERWSMHDAVHTLPLQQIPSSSSVGQL